MEHKHSASSDTSHPDSHSHTSSSTLTDSALDKESIALHKKHQGKIELTSRVPLENRHDFSLAYTPGVAAVSRAIAEDSRKAKTLTLAGRTVAVISDGSAVLGLGNIGPHAAIPVMEGKAAIFKALAGIDAFPITLAFQDTRRTIDTIRNIAPVFAGINLEDFKAPECFVIEEALQDIGIPVMHDDQHGTAIVVLAGLTNALAIAGKDKTNVRVVVNGVGAAGVAITKMLVAAGFSAERILLCDTKGIIYDGRADLAEHNVPKKVELARITNTNKIHGTLADAVRDADVFIGVSKGNLLTRDDIKTMAPDPVIFALANPVPEIAPDEARAGGALIIATGRSDYPNQVNNSLAFPGVFRGAIDSGATRITTGMKLAAAYALADLATDPTVEAILPFATDKRIVPAVASAVALAWREENP